MHQVATCLVSANLHRRHLTTAQIGDREREGLDNRSDLG
jgi:hypothetical protein